VDLPKQLRLKHTIVKAAIKNGAMFEICYAGALQVDEGVRRAWWGCAREAVRACSKGIVFSSGGEENFRAPRDVANLLSSKDFFTAISMSNMFFRVTLLGLAQDQALNTLSKNPKAIIIRAR
jgi:ribonuclease P/MRP protein subunit RPP1